MAATDQLAIVRARRGRRARRALRCRPKRTGIRTRPTGAFSSTQGTVFGMRDTDGRLIATAALLPYTSGNAWISMVLVTANWRRRGLATRLVDACLDAAAKQGLTPWLDATPAGASGLWPARIYADAAVAAAAAGEFDADRRPARRSSLARQRSTTSPRAIAAPWVSIAAPCWRNLADVRARGCCRTASAMALVRDGRTARHIGPLFADHPDQALALVDAIVRSETGAVADRRRQRRKAEFLDGLTGAGWTHRAAVSAHAVRRRRDASRGTAVRRRRPGIRIRMAPCIIAR